ncbi:MAG: 2-dehydropantoate 2-reductase [Balneolaceae bacterium]
MSKFDFKNIMVMGAGGVGGYFGSKLAKGLDAEISWVARGEHLIKIREAGLVVQSIHGDFISKGPASDKPEDLPEPDIILFAVKSYDTSQAIRLIEPVMSERTQVLTLQNGIENIPKLTEAFGNERVIPGLCRIGIRISKPGVLSHTTLGNVVLGEKTEKPSERTSVIHNAFLRAEVDCFISENIQREIWKKFSWNAIFNMLSAAENKKTDQLYDGGKLQEQLRILADEISRVATAERINLKAGDLEKIIAKPQGTGVLVPSTLHDRRSGKKLEYDAFTGALLRLGRKHGIELPEYEKLHLALKEADQMVI